jgi:hypothetical protein
MNAVLAKTVFIQDRRPLFELKRQVDGVPSAGGAMREVEVRLKGRKLADSFGEMREWLDHNDCVPISFDIARGKRGVLLVRMLFAEDHMANAFQRDFGG